MTAFIGIFSFCMFPVLLMAVSVSARNIIISMEDDKSSIIRCSALLNPMIGDVPNPTNCNKYYTCVPAPPGLDYETMPLEMNCPQGPNGPLFYDFRNCSCQYDSSGCFDQLVDRNDFFTCAKVFTPSEENGDIEFVKN